jgi:hypothetical protein
MFLPTDFAKVLPYLRLCWLLSQLAMICILYDYYQKGQAIRFRLHFAVAICSIYHRADMANDDWGNDNTSFEWGFTAARYVCLESKYYANKRFELVYFSSYANEIILHWLILAFTRTYPTDLHYWLLGCHCIYLLLITYCDLAIIDHYVANYYSLATLFDLTTLCLTLTYFELVSATLYYGLALCLLGYSLDTNFNCHDLVMAVLFKTSRLPFLVYFCGSKNMFPNHLTQGKMWRLGNTAYNKDLQQYPKFAKKRISNYMFQLNHSIKLDYFSLLFLCTVFATFLYNLQVGMNICLNQPSSNPFLVGWIYSIYPSLLVITLFSSFPFFLKGKN